MDIFVNMNYNIIASGGITVNREKRRTPLYKAGSGWYNIQDIDHRRKMTATERKKG